MATKRVSNVDSLASTTPTPTFPARTTTAAAPLNLAPPSIRPPPTHSLKHATLATLERYQTHTLTPTAFSTPTPPSYHPRSTTPLPPSAFTHTADTAVGSGVNQSETRKSTAADTALLDSLLVGNRQREAADRRLKLDVADRVSRWSHDVALQGERAVQQMDAMHNQRVTASGSSESMQQSSGKAAGEEEKQSVTLGWTMQGNDKLAWSRKDSPSLTTADTEKLKKQSKKDKDREELAQRMRDMSLAHSPQSAPAAESCLDGLLALGGGYVGSALGVSLSAFRGGEPVVVSEVACEMLSSSAVLPVVSGQQAAGGVGSGSVAAAAPAAATVNGNRSAVGAVSGSPFPTASALHEEVSRVKACVAAAGMYVHSGAVERALGGGRAVAGTALVATSGSVWPVPFSGLVDDPKDKKKRAGGDKKAAVKKAAKKK